MEGLLYLSIFGAVVLLALFIQEVVVPFFVKRYTTFQDRRSAKFAAELEDSFIFWERRKTIFVYLFPFIFAGLLLILTSNFIAAGSGFAFGIVFPNIMAAMARKQRIKKFRSQLVDSMMILSSSLRAGLSFLQAIEVLVEEMPAPASQEFNLILSENKLGVSMEEALKKLRKRIPIEEVNLVVTSILIAREAGGDLPRVLSRLTDTIRDNVKLKEKIGTLTLQGRMQGLIMIFLPIGFAYFVYKKNPGHFDIMLQTDMGRKLLILAVVLQVVGMIMIKRISTMKY